MKIDNEFQSLSIFTKSSILDVWQNSEYASVLLLIKRKYTKEAKEKPRHKLHKHARIIGKLFKETLQGNQVNYL